MHNGRSKVAVIGAGFVGAASAFAMALRQTCSELVLIDIAAEKAAGEAEDIKHGLPFLGQMDIYSGDYSDVKDADVIVITAGANRKPGETRLDLAKKNTAIAKGITEQIMKHYNGGIILVVANPVDILTYNITKWTGLPKGMVLGSGTALDSLRLRSAIAGITGVDISNIHGYIIGEHGDSQVAAWSTTHVAGIQIDKYCRNNGIEFNDDIKKEILDHVKNGGAEIIKKKGATYYGVAVCVSALVDSLLRDSNTIRVVSSVLDGQLGVSDVAVSLPTIIGNCGVKQVIVPKLYEDEIGLFYKSCETCKEALRACNG